ncbi:MAG: hypothetical protein GY719_14585 [bacterium]|nr:hypothetical protein [bacterium]
MKILRTRLIWSVALLALLAAPAMADDVITSGVDLWPTATGASVTSFADDPIPAGFFCPGSKAFDGRIVMNGKPLVTEPTGVLGPTDTVVHRLDDATFDEDGVATTRLQMMALSLVGTEPVDVGCDTRFEVTSTLDGEQPLTEMTIFREGDWGGTYASPLHLNVKVVFTPLDGGEPLGVNQEIYLGPSPDSYWATTEEVGVNAWGEPVKVDTDGDGVADSVMPEASNFLVGMAMAAATSVVGDWCPSRCCHCRPVRAEPPPIWSEDGSFCDPDHLHCIDCMKPCWAIDIEDEIELQIEG